MCEMILFFSGAIAAALLLWIVVLISQLEDYRAGVRDD